MNIDKQNIRNFCIIAHIDHGKSTLADRLLEVTNTLTKREMSHGQMLDTMELEQERGITIKLQPVHMKWNEEGIDYYLNLIDTPGHVDFSYEVSRSLAACEGAILVVDASQGIQAQTLANCYMALEHDLEIIPVLNKIDLPSSDIDKCAKELENLLGVKKDEIICISAKEGTNVKDVLKSVIKHVPAPKEKGDITQGTKSLIFDSVYDPYKGVVSYIRVNNGSIKRGDKMSFVSSKKGIDVLEVGHFKPKYEPCSKLAEGDVGYVVTGVKSVRDAKVGDTLWKPDKTSSDISQIKPLPGYAEVKPFVFAGLFTIEGEDYGLLRDSLEKLQLNDASFTFEPETSTALGHGFRCGFLGLLHMEITQERLEREYNLSLIITAPSVSYKIFVDGEEKIISNPSDLPPAGEFEDIQEPWTSLEIITPTEYTGAIMKLINERRGIYKSMEYMEASRVILKFELPLATLVSDFYDHLKSCSKGYASLSYEYLEYRSGSLIKLQILIAGDVSGPLSSIMHRDEAYYAGRAIVKSLKEIIPRNQFEIPIQAAIGAKVIARETIKAYRKDVTAKLYGGDSSRRKKLLEKQKKGKKRMKQMGKVSIPQEAFLSVLKKS